MESRKYQLQKQIIEAIKANDNDLYSLLKSQWAHRFGVESLEELNNLELTLVNEKLTNKDNQKNDQSQDSPFDADKQISMQGDPNKEEVIKNDTDKVIINDTEKVIINDTEKSVESIEFENKESVEIKTYEIVDKGNHEDNTINTVRENQSPPEVKALIPLPPKPKYGFLKKWLLRA